MSQIAYFVTNSKEDSLYLSCKKILGVKVDLRPARSRELEYLKQKKVSFLIVDGDVALVKEIQELLKFEIPVLALFSKSDDIYSRHKDKYEPNLYYFHYNDHSIRDVVARFARFVELKTCQKGRFIVIDGADGSGKATQSEAIMKYLVKKGKKVLYMDFPQYGKNPYGSLVGGMMRGELGQILQIDPYLATLPYAVDRFLESGYIWKALAKGYTVIANRYVSSNAAHQGSKIANSRARQAYLNWLFALEYNYNLCPKEDALIYLAVPTSISKTLIDQKSHRTYVRGKKPDQAEKDTKHQGQASEIYKSLCKSHKHWQMIDCTRAGKLLPVPQITESIIKSLGI